MRGDLRAGADFQLKKQTAFLYFDDKSLRIKPAGALQCILINVQTTQKRWFAPNLLNFSNDRKAAVATDLAHKFKVAEAMHTQNGRCDTLI